VRVQQGQMMAPETAVVMRYAGAREDEWFYSDLLDYHVPAS